MIRFVHNAVRLLFFSALLLTNWHGVSAATVSRSSAAKHAGPTPSDAVIDATIRAKLAKSKIGKDNLHFKVAHGVVTWEGHTDVIQHKGSATRMAKSAGAAQVVNNIQISPAARAKAAANLRKNDGVSAPSAPKRATVS